MNVVIKNKRQYDDALETLEDLKLARKKILRGGQSYTIGTNQMNRASLKEISEQITLKMYGITSIENLEIKIEPNVRNVANVNNGSIA